MNVRNSYVFSKIRRNNNNLHKLHKFINILKRFSCIHVMYVGVSPAFRIMWRCTGK